MAERTGGSDRAGGPGRAGNPERPGVAVVGMAGRFPGAPGIAELWDRLLAGEETLTRFPREALDPSIPAEERDHPEYVPVRGVLADADAFDAAFFGVTPREADIMDPQQRVFLEVAWEALEAAGTPPGSFGGMVGVYAGMANNSYYLNSVLPRRELLRRFGPFQAMLANEKDFLATRVSHKLDLRGPSISLYTGCSTSLVAVSQAFHSLLGYECDLALAGGVCITWPQESGYLYHEGGIESRDGHCRPFDAGATGTVFSNGVGVVALKRLEDAISDGDHIHAVLRGCALNNDGALKVSFAAPSVAGQAEVIAMAMAQADVAPDTVGYVEAHGTATQLGDPIEFQGLLEAFGGAGGGPRACALGSIKGNFGHLLAAAGVAGLIKTVLAVERGVIPPTVNHAHPNVAIDLAKSPFFVNTEPVSWPRPGSPRRAGVSSFGIGGTNAHVVVEQAPERPASPPTRDPQLLVLSARTPAALDRSGARLGEFLGRHPEADLGDVAFTLQTGRSSFPCRRVVVASDSEAAVRALEGTHPLETDRQTVPGPEPEVAFALPGVGGQYRGMGASLYEGEPSYRACVDECSGLLRELTGFDLAEALYGEAPRAGESGAVDFADPMVAQCAVFVTDYALARTWMAWGVRPRALVGHSVGELVAGVLSEVLTLEDGLRIVAAMGRPAGTGASRERMLAVRLGVDELEARLPEGVEVAAENAPQLSVVAGVGERVEALALALTADGVPHRMLPSNRAFHTSRVAEVVEGVKSVMESVRLRRPRIPWVSAVSGNWIDPHTATDPLHWVRVPRERVRFRQAVGRLLDARETVVLEVGPGATLGTSIRQTRPSLPRLGVVSSLPDEWQGREEEWRALRMAVGKLWLSGVTLTWKALHPAGRRRVPLPTYPFERERHHLSAVPPGGRDPSANTHDPEPDTGMSEGRR